MCYSPKISIITPSYNQGEYIEETIQSVISQEYPNYEYIVIDGGSKDNTVEILTQYYDKIDFWISEADKGQSEAINKGLQKAKGEILAYLNSDDVYTKYTLEKVADYFIKNPDVDMIYGDIELIDQNSKVLNIKREIRFDKRMAHFIGFGLIVPQPAAFWRKSISDKIGLFDENNHFTMDQNYWYKISKFFTIKHIPIVLSKFRIHQTSKTNLNISKKNTPYYQQHYKDLELFYNDLSISKIIPFKYSAPLRKLYRLKRVIYKFFLGKYFS
jgi:glycosyltransferase involved in cell wall biosynthesis